MDARLMSRVWLAVLALATCCVIACSSASAAIIHNYVSSFGSFSSVESIAVDESTGAIYVYDIAAGTLFKFDSSGAPAGFSGLPGEPNAIEGVGHDGTVREVSSTQVAVDNSSGPAKGDIYVAVDSHVLIFGRDGKPLGELTHITEGQEIPVCGVAVDPAGHVYAGFDKTIDKYAPTANPVTASDYVSSLWTNVDVCHLAVDSTEAVYFFLGGQLGTVEKYDASQFNVFEVRGIGTTVSKVGPGVAVDQASNELYVGGGEQVVQYNSGGSVLDSFSGEGENAFDATAVAVDKSTGAVLVGDAAHGRVDVFTGNLVIPDVAAEAASNVTSSSVTLRGTVNPDGLPVTSCQFEYGPPGYGATVPCSALPGSGSGPVEVSAEVSGLQAKTVYHYRLVAGNENGSSFSADAQVRTLSPPFPPVIKHEWASHVGVSTATLNANIDPLGSDTTYHFEYGPTTSYGSSVPVPDGDLGEEGEADVNSLLAGLQPGSAYHYRVVAANVNGTVAGEDHVFRTAPVLAPAGADACPNAAYRGGLSAALPDCRAYEKVSPNDKNGGDAEADGADTQVSLSGDRIAYISRSGFADTRGSGKYGFTQYIASRGEGAWSTHAITPTPDRFTFQVGPGQTLTEMLDDELESAIMSGYKLQGAPSGLAGSPNVYREDTASNQLELLSGPVGVEPPGSLFSIFGVEGISRDARVTAFEAKANLLPGLAGNAIKLYESEDGTLKLAGILPDGKAPSAGSTGPDGPFGGRITQAMPNRNTVSQDGTRVPFLARPEGASAPQLYVRRNGSDTVWVSQSEASAPNPEPHGVKFATMSPDGRHILFTTTDRLTDSDPGGGVGLYEYTDSPDPAVEPNLTFIGDAQIPLGMSDDGSHVYFWGSAGGSGQGLYLWNRGHVVTIVLGSYFISSLHDARVSSDGKELAFIDSGEVSLTSADTNRHTAIYAYSEDRESLACVSCPPSGAIVESQATVEAHAAESAEAPFSFYAPRFLSRDGRFVFFSTADALVPQDTNGLYDAYEYDTETGRVSLLSTGTGDKGSWFADSSASGGDVVIATKEPLLSSDIDTSVDLYDARIGGGLPQPAAVAPPCVGDACQGVPSAAPLFTTASGFSGLGNTPSNPVVKRKAKQKKRPARHRRKRRRRAHARAHHGRVGSSGRQAMRHSGR